jgi:predicted metal-binding membrane protein
MRMATVLKPPASAARGVADGQRRMLALVLAVACALAWAILAGWSASPYARYLGHGGWAEFGALEPLCAALPQGAVLVPAATHALAWVLMIAAMMLPTTYPVLALFRRMVTGRRDARALVALVVAGFGGVWLAFGLAAHAADALVLWLAGRSPAVAAHGWLIGAAVLAGAGLFQWSALKYRCLEACHSPFAFVASRWHGRAPKREALALGAAHGAFCVGCCAALMLVMFVVGMGNLAYMLVLAGVMAAEKNLPQGRRLRAPLGVALLAGAAVLVALHVAPA